MHFVASSLPLFGLIPIWLQPLWLVAVGVLIVLAVLGIINGLLRWLVPKVAAIGWTTSKEAMSQPLFYLLLVMVFSALSSFLSFLTTRLGKISRWSRMRGSP